MYMVHLLMLTQSIKIYFIRLNINSRGYSNGKIHSKVIQGLLKTLKSNTQSHLINDIRDSSPQINYKVMKQTARTDNA